MIIDIMGTILIPGNCGKDCLGNVENNSEVCCCDECDYMICCLPTHKESECLQCKDKDCPRVVEGADPYKAHLVCSVGDGLWTSRKGSLV